MAGRALGWRPGGQDGGQLIEDEKLVPEDQRCMEEIRKMCDSILPMIQLEDEYPNKNMDKKLPILDLKVWVKEEKVGWTDGQQT